MPLPPSHLIHNWQLCAKNRLNPKWRNKFNLTNKQAWCVSSPIGQLREGGNSISTVKGKHLDVCFDIGTQIRGKKPVVCSYFPMLQNLLP